MADEPESLMLRLLRDMRAEIADMRGAMATKDDISELRAEFKSDMHSLRVDVASDFIETRKELKGLDEKITGLRRAVIEYHTTTIGHGVLISELEGRLRRVEQHLNLDGQDSH